MCLLICLKLVGTMLSPSLLKKKAWMKQVSLFIPMSDAGSIEGLVDQVLADNQDKVAEYRGPATVKNHEQLQG